MKFIDSMKVSTSYTTLAAYMWLSLAKYITIETNKQHHSKSKTHDYVIWV